MQMKWRAILGVLVVLGFCEAVLALSSTIDPKQVGLVDQLPPAVTAPEGKLTLWANYAGARDGRITVYIVNRTDKKVSITAQDYDPYIKYPG